MGYRQITIREALRKISSNDFLLPDIQRKMVWNKEQIENLFDSLMCDYPINTFIFWKIDGKSDLCSRMKLYRFISKYKKGEETDENREEGATDKDICIVIDGQQRLTALNIGLRGSYCAKERKIIKNITFNEYELYLDLCNSYKPIEDDNKNYNFKFLTKDEYEILSKEMDNGELKHYWFKVKDILDNKFKYESSIIPWFVKNKLLLNNPYAVETITKLWKCINSYNNINYYEVESDDPSDYIDKILNIFIRTNSGGTKLTFADLLMSITTANWGELNAREEMADLQTIIKKIGNGAFEIERDWILKTMLMLTDKDVGYKLKNFDNQTVSNFENKWGEIKRSIISTFRLLDYLGFNDKLLISKNAIIPIAYYIHINKLADKIDIASNEKYRSGVSKWLTMSLLNGIFGGQSDSVLRDIRKIILEAKNNKILGFPLTEICDHYKNNQSKNYNFSDEVIESYLYTQKGTERAGLILGLLYPAVMNGGRKYDEDHMHPKSFFKISNLKKLFLNDQNKIEFYKDKNNWNSILNLQLLDYSENRSNKGDDKLEEWAKINHKKNSDLLLESSTSLKFEDFECFINDRKKIIINKLKSALSI